MTVGKTTPVVSVLIPCFNAERWVRQAIESALAQTYPDVEVIVVDDGSTDDSAQIIDSFGDAIRYERGPNRGGNAARNRLLELARGNWLQYLDADDYLQPDKIAQQLLALRDRPEVDVLFGPAIIEAHHNGQTHVACMDIAAPHDPWCLLALWHLPQTGAALWRKSAIEDIGGWTVGQRCCQEHELYLRLLMADKRFAYHPASGAVYRQFAGGTVSTRDPVAVRGERLKIENRIERHLATIGELTSARQWAINQSRFEMARIAWTKNPSEARAILAQLKDPASFHPKGRAAPPLYRWAFRIFGFETAEHMAMVNRWAFPCAHPALAVGERVAAD